MPVRGLRGAITVPENSKEAILEGSTLLLETMLEKNQIPVEEICSIFFSVTPDLDKEFPAKSARKMGLSKTPFLCMTEIPVSDAVPRCIRILIQFNTPKSQDEIQPVYLRDAVKLRPDLIKK
ncbi:MAG: chorismate mutase [Candidatus Aureabacteria bacterium]|nr:chorismate mutase [Candidatus Auribacterota bacterium]